TMDRTLPGPDHKASLEPGELKDMVAGIRAVERALGDGKKTSRPSEIKNMAIARKSLVAARDLAKGETITAADLKAKRPGTGVSPMEYWDRLGQILDRDVAEDELI
ncbi:MAG: N-acetylneuraminate synthase, partial [Rhodospirillaceae bacterium]|nr:N-acetylneuraminate synthase [Rhodospirillaceae bacterium]